MNVDKDWTRWVIASVYEWFKEQLAPSPVFVEMADRFQQTQDWFDVRTDGPVAKAETAAGWRLEFIVNVLCSVLVSDDVYAHAKRMGQVQEAMATVICVYKYGDQTGDDQSLVGNLVLIKDMITRQYGRVNVTDPLFQAIVEGRYAIELP